MYLSVFGARVINRHHLTTSSSIQVQFKSDTFLSNANRSIYNFNVVRSCNGDIIFNFSSREGIFLNCLAIKICICECFTGECTYASNFVPKPLIYISCSTASGVVFTPLSVSLSSLCFVYREKPELSEGGRRNGQNDLHSCVSVYE